MSAPSAAGTNADTSPSRARLAALRAALAAQKLDGFVLPLADEHLGEFMPEAARRLAWLTGFTGSWASLTVLADKAALFVDGRYTLQAAQEVDAASFEVRHFRKPPPLEWLSQAVHKGARIGFDPRIVSIRTADQLQTALREAGAEAMALDANPVDVLWSDRPALPLSPVEAYPLHYAGVSADDKITALGRDIAAKGIQAVALNQLDSIAWLFNIRGHDAAHAPMVQGFAIVRDDGRAELLVDRRKIAPDVAASLGNRVAVRDIGEFADALAALGARSVGLDFDRCNAWIRDRLVAAGATVKPLVDPALLPRATKNAVEIAGSRAAHRRDGVAVTRFLHWLATTVPQRRLSELDVVDELMRFRAADPLFRGVSFDTIAGAGPNGAIVHYRPMPATNRAIETGSLLLIDSGGQYLDGTTDITRTVAIGEPTAEMRRHFTQVLKGHIAVAMARFPEGATGGQLDSLARQYLWRAGLDYDHGTGHGVGAYLGVHEGPQRIAVGDVTKLVPGMLISDEPGLYLAGRYGIRCENLVLVVPSAGFEGFLEFETLTLAPFDRTLIDTALLDADERAWLDAYHARVAETLLPQLSPEVAAWLRDATVPLGH